MPHRATQRVPGAFPKRNGPPVTGRSVIHSLRSFQRHNGASVTRRRHQLPVLDRYSTAPQMRTGAGEVLIALDLICAFHKNGTAVSLIDGQRFR